MSQVFVSNPGIVRPSVFKARSDEGRDMVIKFSDFAKRAIGDEQHQELADGVMMGREYSKELHGISSFISSARTAEDNSFENTLFSWRMEGNLWRIRTPGIVYDSTSRRPCKRRGDNRYSD